MRKGGERRKEGKEKDRQGRERGRGEGRETCAWR